MMDRKVKEVLEMLFPYIDPSIKEKCKYGNKEMTQDNLAILDIFGNEINNNDLIRKAMRN